MKFKLEIELGNDAMKDQMDVAMALRKIINDLNVHGCLDMEDVPLKKNCIFDRNGNRVGHWKVTK
jgi:hypothetical protein